MAKTPNSSVPFWLTLGFAAGLACGALYFRNEPTAKPSAAATPISPPEPSRNEIPRDAGSLAALEQTFMRWGGYAVWENNVAQFAAWDPRRRRHSDFIEVRREDRKFYFRTIPALTRPLIDHGPRGVMPLAFTETQKMREDFYRENPNYDRSKEPEIEFQPLLPEFGPRGRMRPALPDDPDPNPNPPPGGNPPPPPWLKAPLTPGAGK